MKALYLKNFRCFAEPGWIPLAPVTLLIGENSSGKTTFLAAARLASDLADERRKVLDFNEDPFRLGAFEQLAHHKGGRGGRAATFELGIERTELLVPIESSTASGLTPLQSELVRTRALFDDVDGQPRLVQTARSSNGLSLTRARPFAFAPIRSEPQRTFDRMMSVPQPSGSHVPMLLAQFDGQKKWAPLRKAIDQFGKSSGLF